MAWDGGKDRARCRYEDRARDGAWVVIYDYIGGRVTHKYLNTLRVAQEIPGGSEQELEGELEMSRVKSYASEDRH